MNLLKVFADVLTIWLLEFIRNLRAVAFLAYIGYGGYFLTIVTESSFVLLGNVKIGEMYSNQLLGLFITYGVFLVSCIYS